LLINLNTILCQPLFGNPLINYHQLDLPGGLIGPESIAFDCNGRGPYVGVSDGRILLWQGPQLGWTEFAIPSPNRDRRVCDGSADDNLEAECGRPLGLKFHPASCDLYIADAYFGLLMVGPNGGVAKPLANSAEGLPFRFTNALDIHNETGVVYFTDSSIIFQRRQNLLEIQNGDRTGRLMTYDPRSKEVTVLFRGLAFPNGVALSKDNSFLLLAETTTMRISKFPIVGNGISTPQLFAQLQRNPDNIQRNDNGEFWVALNNGRSTYFPFAYWLPWFRKDPVGVKYDEAGQVVRVLDGYGGTTLEFVSEVHEHNRIFYLGSVLKPYVGVLGQ
ncbi:Str_synth domain-containing protein, partial [Cephalotus follicularis]